MDERTRRILEELTVGRIPQTVPDDCEYAAELGRLAAHLGSLQRFAMALGNGDLSRELNGTIGPIAGSLKGLQANLRHLTWQTNQVAAGDFSQRIDFMGDFSKAFNSMVERLDAARTELVRVSMRDALTGLYNRAYFEAELERLGRGRRFPVTFINSDINGLKAVNDGYGHAAGDMLIKKAAGLLRAATRGDDVVARVGGDEFVAILPGLDARLAQIVMDRIGKRMSEQEDAFPMVSFAIGAATAQDPEGMPQALREADQRMYQDKEEFKRRSRPG